MSTSRAADPGAEARAAGWAWLATLPRGVVAHAARGDDPLANVRALLADAGDPHTRVRAIHLAGSKGKGSTALFCEALLGALGQRTLTYTSPHLERWTERFRLDGGEAPADEAFAALETVREAAQRTGVQPGFFEALTVAAFVLAERAGVDWAIIECGVGGRADATNVVDPAVALLTTVELEHTDRLGDTLAAIAAEKAGVIKPGRPVVTGPLPPEAEAPVARAVSAAGAERIAVRPAPRPVRTAPGDGSVLWHADGDRLDAAGPGWQVRTRLPAPAPHVAANATLALAAVARLGLASGERLQGAARTFAGLALPGRTEVVSELPWVLVDAAHTPASAEALAGSIRALAPDRVHLLLSVSRGKDVAPVVEALLPLANAVTVTRADADYSLAAETLGEAVRARWPEVALRVEPEPETALAACCADAPGETLVVATGSVYLAGRVRGAFADTP